MNRRGGNNHLKYKTIDLFAGIGGIRRGFEMTNNFENILSAEIDKYACITYEHLFGENPYNDVTSEEFKNKVEFLEYDILLAGFPCQSFSIAGNKKGFKDVTRGTLFFDIADIIKRTNPKAFLLENVEGLYRHDKGKTFNIIIETLVNELNYKVIGVEKVGEDLKYNSTSFLRKTLNFGLPQKRTRTYIMGFRNDLIPKNYKFSELPKKRNKPIFKNLYEILEKDVSAKYYLSEQYIKTLEKHKSKHELKGNGFGYKVVNVGENPISNTILATGGSGKERNLILQEKPEYYGTMFGSKKTPINDKGIRVMTPIEWARLQGFKDYAFIKDGKDKFSFPKIISETQQYKQLGNSVSIPVIESLAEYMYKNLEEMKKMGFNKGEWSELYSFLYLLENPNLVIVDEKLNIINRNVFKIIEIMLSNNNFKIYKENIIKISSDGCETKYDIKYISDNNKILIKKIIAHKKSNGSFEINEIKPLINELFDGKKPKGNSKEKGDLTANVHDFKFDEIIKLNYNIKSSLGSPATLLNASNSTNFIYEIENIDDKIMNQVNLIEGQKKLLDRCNFLNLKNAKIKFWKVESDIFNYNLKMIDSNLNYILAQMLYLSYEKNEKDIQNLIKIVAKDNDEYNFYRKKIGDFANSVTFGMRAGEKWNGKNEVNGGIIIVTKEADVYLLDLIYFKDIVDKYLIENIKLESPSSTRYKMFDIYKENEKYYFKLNLQIRFK